MSSKVSKQAKFLLAMSPSLVPALVLLLLAFTGHTQIGQLTVRETFLIVGLGGVVAGTVLGLLLLAAFSHAKH